METFLHLFILVLAIVFFVMAALNKTSNPISLIAWGLALWLTSTVLRF